MHAIFIHVLITWCLFNVLSFIVKFSLFIARTIHKIFKLSKFRYFYLKRIYLHVRIPNNVFQQRFRDNWNNIFAIINIHYYKYSQCSSETLRRLCFFFSSPFLLFFKHLPPSQSRSKFFEYFPVAKSFVSFFGRHLLLGAYNGNNGETRERVIVSVFLIYNRVPRIRMHYSRLHSVTRKAFQPSSIISRVENPFRWKWRGGRSANHGCIRT